MNLWQFSNSAGSGGGEALRSCMHAHLPASPDVLSGSEVNGAWPCPWGTLPFKSAANITSLHCLFPGKYNYPIKLVLHYRGEGVDGFYHLRDFPTFILASEGEKNTGPYLFES